MPDSLSNVMFVLAAIPVVATVLSIAQRSVLPTDDQR